MSAPPGSGQDPGRGRRPRPAPGLPWAAGVVGGAITGLYLGLFSAPSIAAFLVVPVLHGAASGGLASIVAGRFDRGIVLAGALLGALVGALGIGADLLAQPLALLAVVIVAAMPALLVGATLRMGPRAIVPLVAISFIAMAAATFPLLIVLVVLRSALELPEQAVAPIAVAIPGALSWWRPASLMSETRSHLDRMRRARSRSPRRPPRSDARARAIDNPPAHP